MGKLDSRMDEWQRQWEAMRKDGKNPDEFWKKQWEDWHKDRLAGRNPEWKENPDMGRKKMGNTEKTDDSSQQPRPDQIERELEKEFWKKAWDHHKEDDKWKEPEHFMGPYFQKQWSKMKDEGKSPEEFWKDMWEEMNRHSQRNETPQDHDDKMTYSYRRGPPWMNRKFQEKWQDMERSGKSPADFWKSVKEDVHSDDEKASFIRRFFERRMNKKLDEFIQEGKSPEEMWQRWGEKTHNGRCGWFGFRGQPQRGEGEWKPWMFEYGDHRGMGPGYGRYGQHGGGSPWRHGFAEHGCRFQRRHDCMRKEYDERPIFREFDF